MSQKSKNVLLSIAVATIVLVYGFTVVSAQAAKINGLTIALDTLRASETPQTIINFMKQYHYNGLRIYMGWCSSFWTGNVNSPMNTATQNFIDDLCRLCAENDFLVVCAVSDQVTPWRTAFPEEIQIGPNGERNSQDNWVCPTGPNFQKFTNNLIKILIGIMEKYATPRISVDEIVFVTGGGRPTFYSTPMRNLYQQRTGKSIPIFTSTSGSYNSEQRAFIDFAKGTIREFFEMMEATAKAENPNTWFGALVDTYWVYPRTSYDTQPWDYYETLDELCYEWFYAIQNENWVGITDGLQRIEELNPTADLYFIYGTSTMTTVANMRKSVELVMGEDYDGVFLYEYAKSKSQPFDVSDIVLPETSSKQEPQQLQSQPQEPEQQQQIEEPEQSQSIVYIFGDAEPRNAEQQQQIEEPEQSQQQESQWWQRRQQKLQQQQPEETQEPEQQQQIEEPEQSQSIVYIFGDAEPRNAENS